jgi:hypothetical protein
MSRFNGSSQDIPFSDTPQFVRGAHLLTNGRYLNGFVFEREQQYCLLCVEIAKRNKYQGRTPEILGRPTWRKPCLYIPRPTSSTQIVTNLIIAVSTVVLSHCYFDHIRDFSTFEPSTALFLGLSNGLTNLVHQVLRGLFSWINIDSRSTILSS